MIIAIIHWKIKPNEECKRAFLNRWSHELCPPSANLVGEFLSEPLTPEQTGIPSTIFGLDDTSKYWSFFNVGFWKSAEAFKHDIYDSFGMRKEVLEFEVELPERMILGPEKWRRGELELPTGDQLTLE